MAQVTNTSASATTAAAAERGREVVGDAKSQAQEVAHTAREELSHVGQEAKTQVERLTEDAKEKLREQGRNQSQQAASTVRSWSDQARALAEGRPEEAGPMGDYLQQAAGKVSQVADRLEQRGIEGTLSDLRGFAQRRPGVFLAAAGLAGLLVGRLARGARESANEAAAQQPVTSYGGHEPVAQSYDPNVGSYPTTDPVTAAAARSYDEGSGNGHSA